MRAEVFSSGKLFVFGEWSVLHGGSALLTSVPAGQLGRADTVEIESGVTVASPHFGTTRTWHWTGDRFEGPAVEGFDPIGAVIERSSWPAPPVCGVELEVSPEGMHAKVGGKLGFGSSATVAVLTAWALELCRAGVVAEVRPQAVLAAALDGHSHAQGGRGSGADVGVAALSLRPTADRHHGTLVEYRMAGPSRPLKAAVVSRSPNAHLLAVWTGVPADTRVLMERVASLSDADPTAHRQAMSDLSAVADSALAAWRHADLDEVLGCVNASFEALEHLGALARCPIVIDEHRTIAEIVRQASDGAAAAKPSGAGGGDMALVVSAPQAAEEVRAALDARGLLVVDLGPVGPSALGS